MYSQKCTYKKCNVPLGLKTHVYQIICVQAHDRIDDYFVDKFDGMYAFMPSTPLEEITPAQPYAYFEMQHPTSVELLRVGLT